MIFENESLLDMKEKFGFRQLCLVNSSSNAYAEMPVHKHLVLNGGNNQGKTASLNVIKLVLFPEFNFSNCASKFGFQGRNGDYYSKQDTFEHYFPTNQSYIIVEATNPEGNFCIVLYRASGDFSFGRILVPKSLKEIRTLFWDFTTNDNEGMGSPAHIDKVQLLSQLKGQGGILVNDVNTLCEHIFGGAHSLGQRRFCLVPLIDGGKKESVKCLRSLINLAFDLTASNSDTLPKVLASVIEMKKDREESQVKVNLLESIDKYKTLAERQQALDKVRDNIFVWQKADESVLSYKRAIKTQAVRYHSVLNTIDSMLTELKPKKEILVNKEIEAGDKSVKAHKDAKSLHEQFLSDKGVLKQKSNELKEFSEKKIKLDSIRGAWGASFDITQAITDASEAVSEAKKKIEGINNDAKAQENLQHKIKEKNELIEQQRQLKEKLNNHSSLLLSQVSQKTANILFNINPRFAEVFHHLSDEQTSVIEGFVDLFEDNDHQVSLFGLPIHQNSRSLFSANDLTETLNKQLSEINSHLVKVGDAISDYQDSLKASNADKPDMLNGFKNDLAEAKEELTILNRANEIDRRFKELSDIYPQMKIDNETLEKEHLAAKALAKSLKSEHEALTKEKKELLPNITKLESFKVRLNNSALPYKQTFDVIKVEQLIEENIDEELIHTLDSSIQQLSTKYEQAIGSLKALFGLELISSFNSLKYTESLTQGDITRALSEFGELFNTLEQSQNLLSNEIGTHNNDISLKINEIKLGTRLIDSRVAEINRNFEHCAISDLETVNMVVEKNPQFAELERHLARNNPEFSDNLIDQAFYERLNKFCLQHFTSKDNSTVIKMENLITKVRYEYQKIGSSVKTSKPQSGGTTATTNCILLSYLLHQLTVPETEVNIPIVMDEIGNLDSTNIPEVRKIADEFGFTLFAATPDLNPSVIDALNNYVTLGEYICDTPVAEEALTICFKREEYFGDEVDENTLRKEEELIE